ncbi:ras association domain-containing protein 4 isoform X2 [Aquarana catesbeiana]|uniref:ras association domain-containing protein 4 isoform X2 n=1 Tax=Aquarana catesbeiana TaxID=8400 RepID=UPI003CC9608D
MGDGEPNPYVKISSTKYILRSELLSLLRTYNCYHEGKNFQLRHHEEGGELVVEGLLNISWGLRRPIRLQVQDVNERICFSSSEAWSRASQGKHSIALPIAENQENMEEENNNSCDRYEEETTPQLKRTRSDASFVQRRSKHYSPEEMQRLRNHRFSINGHFYDHKTSVFTPAYSSVTNVRVTSTMNTSQVLNLLLKKFRVAQYIKFEMPVLCSFVEKLKEEEDREINKLTKRYNAIRLMMLQRLEELTSYESYA